MQPETFPEQESETRLVERDYHEPTDKVERALRPEKLAEFIGQPKLKENLNVFISATKSREESLDHCLFYGPPGLGKTTLAQIMAKEMNVNFRATSGPIITKAGDLAALLTNMQANDVLFIDEIHRLSPAVEEVLYPAMEDYKLDIMIGEGPAARSVQIDLPPFTLIGATTRSGLITKPLRERFGILGALEFYSLEDLAFIVSRSAGLLNLEITKEGAEEVAKRSRGTPRVAGRLLRRVRDFADYAGTKVVDKTIADKALSQLEVDHLGLDAQDRRYLRLLTDNYGGGPAGIDTLAAALSEQRDVLEEVIEPFLIQQGLLQRTPRGRMLTQKGFEYLGLTPPKTFNPNQLELPTE